MLNVRTKFPEALNLMVGRSDADGKPYTAQQIVDASCGTISRDAVLNHLRGQNLPDLPSLMIYMRVLPASFANAIIGCAGLVGATKQAPTVEDAKAALADMAEFIAALAGALADSRIDHTEGPVLAAMARERIEQLQNFVACLERGTVPEQQPRTRA